MTTIRDFPQAYALRTVDQVKRDNEDYNQDIAADLSEESLASSIEQSLNTITDALNPGHTEQPQAEPAQNVQVTEPAHEQAVDPLAGLDPIQRRLTSLNVDVRRNEETIADLRQHHAKRGAELHAELDEHRRYAMDKERALLREMADNQAELDGQMRIRELLLSSTLAAIQVLDPPPADVKAVGTVAVPAPVKRKRPRKARSEAAAS